MTAVVKIVTAATTLMLLAAAGVQMFLVIPQYRRLLESLGVEPNLPSRLAIAASRAGLVLFAVAILGSAAAFTRDRGKNGYALVVFLSLVSLAAAVYLGLAACVHWTVVDLMNRVR